MTVISVNSNQFVSEVYKWNLSDHLWIIRTSKNPCIWDKKQAKIWLPFIKEKFPAAKIVPNYKRPTEEA